MPGYKLSEFSLEKNNLQDQIGTIIKSDKTWLCLLLSSPALVTFPDICITKPSDKKVQQVPRELSSVRQCVQTFLTIKFLLATEIKFVIKSRLFISAGHLRRDSSSHDWDIKTEHRKYLAANTPTRKRVNTQATLGSSEEWWNTLLHWLLNSLELWHHYIGRSW